MELEPLGLKNHYLRIKRILIAILALNWAIAFAKIIYGLFSNCSSITADGFHSLSDGASNIIGLVGIRLAAQPTDSDHPYGHRKYETLYSLGIAFLLFIVAFNLAKEGINRLHGASLPRVDIFSFAVMFSTLAVNIAVARYEYAKGKALQSDILVSDSLHTRADILTSLSVIAALVVIKIGYPLIDPIITILISCFIAYSGIRITKEASRVLCDSTIITDPNEIVRIVLAVRGVKACHKIRTRGRPDDIHIDLHVQVNPDMHVDKAHKISYEIEEAIKKGIPQANDVIVHIEPKEKIG